MLEGLRTFIGILIAAIPTLATLFGYDVAPDFTGDATEIAAGVVVVVGSLIAIYGRVKAKGPHWFAKRA